MKTFTLNIKQVYLDLIKNNLKKHEYRLANEARREIKFGDELILKSELEEIKVIVINIKIYKDWQDALTMTWKQDFKGIYQSIDECINACEQFYKQEDVKKYGIIVYEIKNK